MNVRCEVVVPYGISNATVRARAIHWVDRLEQSAVIEPGSVRVRGPGFENGRPTPDVPLLLVRNAGRLTRGRREAQLLRRARLGVYDLDDGLPWDTGNLPDLGGWYKRPFNRAVLAERCAAAADRIVVGNDVLAEWAAARCDDVRIVPTCIEPGEYSRRQEWRVGERPVIGWIGSPATEVYLRRLAPVLADVHARTGAVVEMISGPGSVTADLAPFTRRVTWSLDAVTAIAGWDVGVMPLRDGVYERAKCGYKLLQYAASGVPAIGDPVGVNARLLADMDGLAPGDLSEWNDAIVQLLAESPGRRAARAAAGFDVAAAYSYATWQARWVDAVGW